MRGYRFNPDPGLVVRLRNAPPSWNRCQTACACATTPKSRPYCLRMCHHGQNRGHTVCACATTPKSRPDWLRMHHHAQIAARMTVQCTCATMPKSRLECLRMSHRAQVRGQTAWPIRGQTACACATTPNPRPDQLCMRHQAQMRPDRLRKWFHQLSLSTWKLTMSYLPGGSPFRSNCTVSSS